MAETVESKIKSGYKETEVGVIPDEWDVKIFGECFKHLRAYTFSRNQLNYEENEDSIYNIHYGDIHSAFPRNLLDVKKDIDLIPIIINPELDTPELLKDGDLIMADASEDYKGIGQSIELINVGDKKIVSGTHTFPLRPIEQFAPKYAGYIFSSYNTHKDIKRIATGISVYGISKSNIAKIQLPIPPLPEQKVIADCLSIWDKGIEKLSTLIASKKEQKKGLMQQLLTGKKRLDGFTEKWQKIEIIECLKYEQPTKYLTNNFNKNEVENKTPVLTANKSFILGYTDESFGIYHDYPAIIFDDFTTASRYIDFPFKVKSSAIKFLKQKKGYDLKFLFEKLQLIDHDISSHKRRWISEFQDIVLSIPSLKEQNAIATVSITFDKEIELLEKKLEVFKLQKMGLMQVLLTGEKRLV